MDPRLLQDPPCGLFVYFRVPGDRDLDSRFLRMLSEVVIPTVDDDPSSLPQCLVNVFSFLFIVSLTSCCYFNT